MGMSEREFRISDGKLWIEFTKREPRTNPQFAIRNSSMGMPEREFRISDCELWIEFTKGEPNAQIRNSQSAIRQWGCLNGNFGFRMANCGLNLQKGNHAQIRNSQFAIRQWGCLNGNFGFRIANCGLNLQKGNQTHKSAIRNPQFVNGDV